MEDMEPEEGSPRSAEAAAKPRETANDNAYLSRVWRGGNRRVAWRELPPHLIDHIAPKIMGPADDSRVIAIGQAGIDGRGCAVTGAGVRRKVPSQRETSIDGVMVSGLVIHTRAPRIEPRNAIERAFVVAQNLEDVRIGGRGRGQCLAQICRNSLHVGAGVRVQRRE